MSRTFKDVPYRVAAEREGIEEKWLYPACPESRRHFVDIIFYAHEVTEITEFETALANDSRYDSVVHEVNGHLISKSREPYLFGRYSRIGDEQLNNLADLSRLAVGFKKPAANFLDYGLVTMSPKSNVFKVYQLFLVSERREAMLEVEKCIPYWKRKYAFRCSCEYCRDPRKDHLPKRAARQLDSIARDFNSGVPIDELEDYYL